MERKFLKNSVLIVLILTLVILTGCNSKDESKGESNENVNEEKAIGLKSSEIPEEDFGSIVTNYECDKNNAVSKWRILYADDEHVYLIADDYISYENVPKNKNGESLIKTARGTCTVAFANLNNKTYDSYNGSKDIIDNNKLKSSLTDWHKWINEHPDDSNTSSKTVAYMLDTDVWNGFAGEKADYAIGGPTLEMIAKSYNARHGDSKIDYESSNYGYMLKLENDGEFKNNVDIEMEDDLLVIKDSTKAAAMWVASPSAYASMTIMDISSSGKIGYAGVADTYLAFRPVVVLSSDTLLEKNVDGEYEIK